jgi:hypothetical protein
MIKPSGDVVEEAGEEPLALLGEESMWQLDEQRNLIE